MDFHDLTRLRRRPREYPPVICQSGRRKPKDDWAPEEHWTHYMHVGSGQYLDAGLCAKQSWHKERDDYPWKREEGRAK